MEYSFDSKGTTIQGKNKVERTKKRTNDYINKSLISSTIQRNHGGERYDNKQTNKQTNKQQTNTTDDHNTLSGSQDPRANKLN